MKAFIYITLFLSSISLLGQIDSKIVPGDAQDFEMSKWDDKTAYLDWKIYGDEGKYKEGNIILITNMKLDIYDGSEQENKKIAINSELAEVYVTTKSAGGDDEIIATSNSFKLEGKTWLWESTNRKVSIFNGVTIHFTSEEKGVEGVAKSKIGYFFHLKDENIFELERNVHIADEGAIIECEHILIKTDKDSMRGEQKSARSIDAKGDVKVLWDNQVSAKADVLEIEPAKSVAILLGNASLEDKKSNTEVFGSKITLDREQNKAKVYSDTKQRAKASIPQKGEGDNVEIVDIYADEILMSMKDEEVEINFVGNVVLKSKDINASCNKMTSFALKKDGADDFELIKLLGLGNVSMSQAGRDAFAQSFTYTPADGKVVLDEEAFMQDEEKGVKINAHSIILERDENKALAFSKEGDEESFVHIRISELNSDELKGMSELNIFSRSLTSIKNGDDITFNFEKDVKVKSENIQASCQKMNIYAKGKQKGRSQVSKIEAFEDFVVKQDQYIATSELARIFPNAKISNKKGETNKSYTELLTSSAKPEKRPRIILPPIGNVGMNEEISEGKAYKNTEITSDKQSLIEGDEVDRYFFEGNVIVDSTDMIATCNKIEVRMNKTEDKSAKKISQIIATENVCITQGSKEATAGRCDMFPEDEMLSLTENPVVLDKENGTRAVGHRISYRKGIRGISIEGDTSGESEENRRPTITLPPIK